MLDKKLFDILAHDGIVAIATCCDNVPHVVNTWHNYVNVTEDGRLLIPAGGMAETERNIAANNKIVLALGSSQVEGLSGSMGAGFCIEGTAKFLSEGADYDMMHEKFSWLSRVLEVTVTSMKETM